MVGYHALHDSHGRDTVPRCWVPHIHLLLSVRCSSYLRASRTRPTPCCSLWPTPSPRSMAKVPQLGGARARLLRLLSVCAPGGSRQLGTPRASPATGLPATASLLLELGASKVAHCVCLTLTLTLTLTRPRSRHFTSPWASTRTY
eukprot:scaffold28284_cov54-Phaeocystis_antarctica.AAC.1